MRPRPMATTKIVRVALIPGRHCEALVFHPRLPLLAILDSTGQQIDLIDCDRGTIVNSTSTETPFDAIAFDAAGKHLVAVSSDTVQVWQVTSTLTNGQRHQISVNYDLYDWFPTFSSAGEQIWMLFEDQWQLWSLQTGALVTTHPAPTGERLLRVTQGPDPVAVTYDEMANRHPSVTVSAWNLRDGRCLSSLPLAEWRDVVVSHDASRALITSVTQGVFSRTEVWDIPVDRIVRHLEGNAAGSSCQFCHDNRHALSRSPDQEGPRWTWLAVLDTATGGQQFLDTGLPTPPYFRCSKVTPVAALIVNDLRHSLDTTQFWNPITGERLAATGGHLGLLGLSAYSPDGRWFATGPGANALNSPEVVDEAAGFVVISDLGELSV